MATNDVFSLQNASKLTHIFLCQWMSELVSGRLRWLDHCSLCCCAAQSMGLFSPLQPTWPPGNLDLNLNEGQCARYEFQGTHRFSSGRKWNTLQEMCSRESDARFLWNNESRHMKLLTTIPWQCIWKLVLRSYHLLKNYSQPKEKKRNKVKKEKKVLFILVI